MQRSLTDRLATTPHLLTECEGCVVVEPLQFFPVSLTIAEGGQFFRAVPTFSATNSNPVGSQPQDGAEGRSLSPALGAHNFPTLDHAATANGKAQQDHG